jgi:hypothetical protein
MNIKFLRRSVLQRVSSRAVCVRLIVLSSVLFHVGCNDLGSITTTLENKCSKNPESANCQSYKTVELSDNPSTVEIKNSERNSTLVVSSGDLEGLSVYLEKGSFDGSLNLTIGLEWFQPDVNLVGASGSQLTNSFGLGKDELMPKLSVVGSTRLIKPAKLTLPTAMTDFMTRDELDMFLIELTNQSGKITVIPNADILVTGTGINTTYSIMLPEWGHMKVLSGKPIEAPDVTAPTVTLTSSAGTTTNVSPIPVTITFSEDVTGFAADDLIVGNGTVTELTGSGTTYTASIAATTQGSVTIDIAAKAAIDAAQNPSSAATQLSIVYDANVPSVGAFSASTGVGNTGFTLNWTAASDSVTPTADLHYLVCSGANTAAINTVSECESMQGTANLVMDWTANTRTKVLTGLSPSTTYYYNVLVRDGAGNKAIYGGRTQSTTADTTAPTPGAFVASTGVGNTGFTLNWSAGSDNVTPAADLQYLVCSGASAGAINTVTECRNTRGTANLVQDWTPNILSITINSRTPATTYYYNVLVRDAAGRESVYGGRTQSTTADTTAPTPGDPSTITPSSVNESSMTLSWSAGTDNVTAASSLEYYVCSGASTANIDSVSECENATQVMDWTTDTLTTSVSGLTPSTPYHYNVLVRDSAGNKNFYTPITQATTADITPPTVGSSSTTTDISLSSITLAWTAASDTITPTANLQYYTCRATSDANINTATKCEDADTHQVMNWTTNTLTTASSGLTPGTTYFFRTLVRDGAGNKAIYASMSATTPVVFSTTTNGERDSSSQHTFYDSVHDRHWIFYLDGSDLKYRYSADNITWTAGTAMTAPATKFAMHYKAISGTPYVFMVNEASSFDIVVRRGTLSNSGVTFGNPVTVFDGTSLSDSYKGYAVVTDDTNLWVASSKFNGTAWQAMVRESTNGADADIDLPFWQTASNLGALSPNHKAITLLPKGGEDIYAVYKDGEAVMGYTMTSGTWSAVHTGGDLAWLSLSGANGTNGWVSAAVWIGSDLYIGGSFTTAGGVSANGVAKWDGTSWSALGAGVGGVSEMAVIGSDLYVAGQFTTAGGIAANRIAKWNGTSWSALGSGVAGSSSYAVISALAVNGSDLYVGGQFITAGGISANGVAKWNGSSWSTLGAGVFGVNAMALMGSDLYVAGNFSTAGEVSANSIAKWNITTSTWSTLGSGVNNNVYALAVSGTDLYVGGMLTTAGGVSASRVAKWNSTTSTWSALGSGVSSWAPLAIVVSGSDVYVGGDFPTAGGVTVNNIAKWNITTSTWSTLGSGVSGAPSNHQGQVSMLAIKEGELYMGGLFTTAGGTSASNLAKWSGSSWSAIGSSGANTVHNASTAFAVIGTDLYLGGDFTTIGGISANRIAKWNGSSWSTLGSGLNGKVTALAASGSDLYVGGSFTTAGGSSANNIAKWNSTTSTWSALGSGVNNQVSALAVSGNDLYVGGNFTTAGGNSANYVAKWNATTSTWSALGSGVGGSVNALAVNGSDLYVGGGFTTVDGIGSSGKYIAKWDGSSWSALGSTASSAIVALAVIGTDVYAGGYFSEFIGGSWWHDRMAKWNGSSWSRLGSGSGIFHVSTLLASGTDLYVGGLFSNAGGVSANNVAKWNGSSWSALGSGSVSTVTAIALSGNQVFTGSTSGVSVFTSAITSTSHPISAAVNNTNDLTLTYIDSAGLVKAKTFTSGAWTAATNIQATGASSAPQISSVPGTDDFVAFWYRSGAWEYKRYDGTTWDASATTLIPASVNSRYASCDPFAGDSIIKCIATSKTSSPFDVTTWSMTP